MKTKLKKIFSIISTVLVVIIILFALMLGLSRLLGYRVFSVISGSMSPTYNVGDMIYVKSVSPLDIHAGDPITFMLNESKVLVTHRVVEVDKENRHFYTKGDANSVPDDFPVLFDNVIGVPQFSIPKLGYVSDFIQNPPGLYITIGICAALFIIVFIPDLFRRRENDDTEDEKTKEENDTGSSG